LSGTSMATPHVTGSAALVVAYMQSTGTVATPQSVKNAIVYNGKAQSDTTFGLKTVVGIEPVLYSAVLTPAPAGYVAPF
jgi:subtilisin family serine protease